MLKLLRSAYGRIARNPLKGLLLLLAFALNAAVLASVFSVALTFGEYVTANLLLPGTGVWISTDPTGDPGAARKTVQFYNSWVPELKERAGLKLASPFIWSGWDALTVGSASYVLRGTAALGVYPDYAAMCDLRMVTGSFFSETEVSEHRAVAVVSENVARAIWGSAVDAVGGELTSVPRPEHDWEKARTFQVVGVFAEPPEIQRRFRYIPSVFVPYDYFDAGGLGGPAGGMLVYEIRAQSDDPSLFFVKRRIREAFQQILRGANMEFDSSTALAIWEGSLSDQYVNEDAAFLGRIRVLSSFFALMGVFCLLLLAFGILALLSSDTAGRLKETGLRRAMGSTRARVIALVAGEAAVILVAANLMGDALMLAFIGHCGMRSSPCSPAARQPRKWCSGTGPSGRPCSSRS